MRLGFIWLAGVRDLQWRRRRFVIAVLGTSLVFALTLLLSGFQSTFDVEVRHTLKLFGADGYLVQAGRPGPFTGGSPIPQALAERASELDGITDVAPVLMMLQVTDRKVRRDVFIIGTKPGSFVAATPTKGRAAREAGEAVVDTRAGIKIGDTFHINRLPFKAVGTLSDHTVLGGRATIYLSLKDAQLAVFGGEEFVTAIAVRGEPTEVPEGAVFVNNKTSGQDLKRPLADTIESIQMFRNLLWVVAAAIVGSVIYLSALERIGDFAVFKATGTATRELLGALVTQAVVLSLAASILSIGVAYLLRGMFPVTPLLPASLCLTVPVIGVIVGVLASGAALRRAVTVDPALAFGGR